VRSFVVRWARKSQRHVIGSPAFDHYAVVTSSATTFLLARWLASTNRLAGQARGETSVSRVSDLGSRGKPCRWPFDVLSYL
jgi:hypothetical protein